MFEASNKAAVVPPALLNNEPEFRESKKLSQSNKLKESKSQRNESKLSASFKLKESLMIDQAEIENALKNRRSGNPPSLEKNKQSLGSLN